LSDLLIIESNACGGHLCTASSEGLLNLSNDTGQHLLKPRLWLQQCPVVAKHFFGA